LKCDYARNDTLIFHDRNRAVIVAFQLCQHDTVWCDAQGNQVNEEPRAYWKMIVFMQTRSDLHSLLYKDFLDTDAGKKWLRGFADKNPPIDYPAIAVPDDMTLQGNKFSNSDDDRTLFTLHFKSVHCTADDKGMPSLPPEHLVKSLPGIIEPYAKYIASDHELREHREKNNFGVPTGKHFTFTVHGKYGERDLYWDYGTQSEILRYLFPSYQYCSNNNIIVNGEPMLREKQRQYCFDFWTHNLDMPYFKSMFKFAEWKNRRR
jgi:hypothetical protein